MKKVKALLYVDWTLNIINKTEWTSEQLSTKLIQGAGFYSQPFTIEMLVGENALFEGFKKEDDNWISYIDGVMYWHKYLLNFRGNVNNFINRNEEHELHWSKKALETYTFLNQE